MELEAWCCYWYCRFLHSAHSKHKYISLNRFFGIVTQEGKVNFMSENRWQSAFAAVGNMGVGK